ncbi:MAG: DegT/DnrJ/EryC1/StrS family aminotransferase [Magnetospiraceae bacterium]
MRIPEGKKIQGEVISQQSGALDAAEAAVAETFGRRHCLLVGSGTTALSLAVQALRPTGDGMAVFPSFTCETAINAAIFAGLTPVFAECARGKLVAGWEQLQAAAAGRDAVIVPTHLFGQMVDLPRDIAAAGAVVEDAAQAYGGRVGGRAVGTLARLAILSFGPDKLVHCGGGAVMTDETALIDGLRALRAGLLADLAEADPAAVRKSLMQRLFALRRERLAPAAESSARRALLRDHRLGYLSGFDAGKTEALCAAMDRFPQIRQDRHAAGALFTEAVRAVPGVDLLTHSAEDFVVPWRFSFLVPPVKREAALEALRAGGLAATAYFDPLHRMFGGADADFPNAVAVASRIINMGFPLDGIPDQSLAWRLRDILKEVLP